MGPSLSGTWPKLTLSSGPAMFYNFGPVPKMSGEICTSKICSVKKVAVVKLSVNIIRRIIKYNAKHFTLLSK